MKKISKIFVALIIPCLFCTGIKADVGPLTMPFSILKNPENKLIAWGLVISDNILTSGYFIEKDRLVDQYNQGLIGYYRYERQKVDLGFVHFFQAMISIFSSKAFITGYKAVKIIDPPSQKVQ